MRHMHAVELGTPALAELTAEQRGEVRHLWLTVRAGGLAEGLAAVGRLEWPALTKVTLVREYLGGARVQALAALPAGVTELALNGCTLDDAAMTTLAGMAVLGQLRGLTIEHAHMTAARLAPLLASPRLAKLERLGLFTASLGPAGAELLARSGLAELRALDVTRTGLGPAGLAKLLAGAWPRLELLKLNDNQLGDVGVGEVAGSAIFKERLVGLDLGANGVGAAGIEALARVRPAALAELVLFANPRIADGIAALAAVEWPRLKALELRIAAVGDAGAVALANGPLLTTVEDLNLDGDAIDEVGAVALADSPRLGRLQRIVLSDNPLGVRGVAALRGSRWAVVREAGRRLLPRSAGKWPAEPARRGLKAARAAVAGAEDVASAWARIVAQGKIEEDARRRFRCARVETCRSCHGYPVDGAGDMCQYCVDGREVAGWTDEARPGSVDDVIAFAADAAVAATLEGQARELARRLARFAGREVWPERVVWYFTPRAWWNGAKSPWCLEEVATSLAKELGEAVSNGGPLWVQHCWLAAAGRDPRGRYGRCEDPCAPYLAILDAGYSAHVEADAVVLSARRKQG